MGKWRDVEKRQYLSEKEKLKLNFCRNAAANRVAKGRALQYSSSNRNGAVEFGIFWLWEGEVSKGLLEFKIKWIFGYTFYLICNGIFVDVDNYDRFINSTY
jgi:hypothetical protein